MSKNLIFKGFALLLVVLSLLPSCATILGGSRHKVHVNQGTPPDARVFRNGEFVGEAPESFKVQKNAKQGNSYIEIKADGYETSRISLTRKVSVGFTVLDICCGILPLAIDFATGNIYKQRPRRIDYFLEMKDGYINKSLDLKVGDQIIFTHGKYKNQEGEIVAIYPDRALIKFRRPATLVEKTTKIFEEVEEQIEVPNMNIAKK